MDVHAVTEAGRESGVPHGAALLAFAEAVVGGDPAATLAGEGGGAGDALARARRDLIAAMGVEAMVDAAAVASNFERMVRIADGTGIPLGERLESYARGVIDELGLERLRR